jgi:FkbM family methyltransferase
MESTVNEFFDLELLVEHGVEPEGIVHIGAHYGQEAGHYRKYVGEKVAWVEAHPDYYAKLADNPELGSQLAVNACISNVTGETVDFYITKDEYASSLLKPEFHQVQNPHAPITGKIQVTTTTYSDLLDNLTSPQDRLLFENANVLVLDVQGAEIMVLEGMGSLDQFDAVATEYSTVEFYEGGPRLADLDEFLGAAGFRRVFPNEEQVIIHADALYVR